MSALRDPGGKSLTVMVNSLTVYPSCLADRIPGGVVTHPTGSSRLLRALNESAALAHLLGRGPLTRPQLRELTGLSKPTVSEAVRRLAEAGLIRVAGHASGGPGPNAEVYAV